MTYQNVYVSDMKVFTSMYLFIIVERKGFLVFSQHLKKAIVILVAVMMLFALFTGCTGKEDNAEEATTSTEAKQQSTVESTAKQKEPVTLTVFSDANRAETQGTLEVIRLFEEKTGIKVKYNPIPGTNDERLQKIDIALMSGDTTDLIFSSESYLNKVGLAELALRLNDIIKKDKEYDAIKVHGKYLPTYNNGGIYGLPLDKNDFAVFYNKKIFDDAGVPYPDGTWTWDEYIETAQKLTDPAKGIYGSYMPIYPQMRHIKANMAGISAYKEDGTSNFGDPVFTEGLQFYKDLGEKYKIQPTLIEQKLKKMGSFEFMNGKYGMIFINSWYFTPITDLNKYPRDWKIGVAVTPKFNDIENNCNFGSASFLVVNKNSLHPEEAYEYAKFSALNYYLYDKKLPAIENISEEEMRPILEEVEKGTNGEITVKDLYKAYFDNGLGYSSEMITGIIGSEYINIFSQESELYLSGDIPLQETVDNVVRRANQAIEKVNK